MIGFPFLLKYNKSNLGRADMSRVISGIKQTGHFREFRLCFDTLGQGTQTCPVSETLKMGPARTIKQR